MQPVAYMQLSRFPLTSALTSELPLPGAQEYGKLRAK